MKTATISEYLNKYEQILRLKNYSTVTISTYKSLVGSFLKAHKEPPYRINTDQILKYALGLNSAVSQNQLKGALSHLYVDILNQPQKITRIPRAKRKQQIPQILSMPQVRDIIEVTQNLKHKALIAAAYFGALRVSEVCHLKISEIQNQTFVITGKGNKQRMVPVSDYCLQVLRAYYIKYKPSHYLFPGEGGNKPYSPTSMQKVVQRAAAATHVNYHVTTHTLRHSRATHLLEQGMDIHSLQLLLGHSKLETTTIYTHVSQTHKKETINTVDTFFG